MSNGLLLQAVAPKVYCYALCCSFGSEQGYVNAGAIEGCRHLWAGEPRTNADRIDCALCYA
jgi:hypothetical protein